MASGSSLQAQSKTEAPATAYREAAEHFEKTYGPDQPDTRAARQLASSVQAHQPTRPAW
jgi:hypothetical protein